MDKNKQLKEIKELVGKKQYSLALKMLESMDIQTELSQKDLAIFAEVYICNKEFSKAKTVLEVMFKNNATKKVISQLIFVTMIMGELDEAENYYNSYLKIAPNDINALVFRYRIDKAKEVEPVQLIKTLQELESKSYSDEFAYDLAEVYYKMNDVEACVKKCNEMIVLSSNKSYISMANSLKDKAMKNVKGAEGKGEKTHSKSAQEKKETVSLGELFATTKDVSKSTANSFSSKEIFEEPKANMRSKGNSIDNIEAQARLNIELSAKKALEDKFKALEDKKRELERKLKIEKSVTSDLQKKIKNYEVIKKSLEDKINIQDKNKGYLEEQLRKAEESYRACEQKYESLYEQKLNLESKFNKLDELSKNQSEKLIKEVANSRRLDERLNEKELKVDQLIERLQLEEKTKSQLINNLETKEKYCENIENRLRNAEEIKSDLEIQRSEDASKIRELEEKLARELSQVDLLDMQVKNLENEKSQMSGVIRQLDHNCKVLQHNLNDHVKHKQMLENRCSQIMEHKRHMELRYRDAETHIKELDAKIKEQNQNLIFLEDTFREAKEDYENYKKNKQNEIERLNESHSSELLEKEKEAKEKENELKIEKEQLRRRCEKDKSDIKEQLIKEHNEAESKLETDYNEKVSQMESEHKEEISKLEKECKDTKLKLESELQDMQTNLEAEIEKLNKNYKEQSEVLERSVADNKMLDNTLKEKISIINTLDARIKDVMTERKRLADKNRELEHRLGIEIGNNKKLDNMVTEHIEGKGVLEAEIARSKEHIAKLDSKNQQGVELIKRLEERVQAETNIRMNLEKALHETGSRCASLEKELREIKNQLKDQRNKEISLVEKSGEELLSMAFDSDGMSPSDGIELDDLAASARNDKDGISVYDTLTTSVSQFLDEIVDDFDDLDKPRDISSSVTRESDEGMDVLKDIDDEPLDIFKDDFEEDKPVYNPDDDGLPMIDMTDLEQELNLSPHSAHLSEVTDVNEPAPRLGGVVGATGDTAVLQSARSAEIGSFFDSPDVPEYKKSPYDNGSSVVSQLFGSSDDMAGMSPDEVEKKAFYQEIMHSQMYEPFENARFTESRNGDYKQETLNNSIFAYYYYSPVIMDMIQKVVFGMSNNSRMNHIIVTGPNYYNKADLCKMIAKQMAEKNIISTNKIARISGEAFNKVDLDAKAPKLLDGTVIIHHAECLNSAAFDKLTRLISNYDGRIVVMLETSIAPAMMFANNREASKFFRGVVNLPKYSVDFILEYVRTVLSVRGMGISREAENDLANMFNRKIKNNDQFTLEDLFAYVNGAIETAQKRKKGRGKHPTDIIIRQDINTNW